ncbi:hypothetical protein MAR_031032 [Mya arenaria]|uniref:Uncharacterized protein n=1 Tax=Mya arenaria TaxID=6604 RepID=A0ABY7F2M9_MYAAR|nr:hypothetical protein MAR_031032 [Mya arenaria]
MNFGPMQQTGTPVGAYLPQNMACATSTPAMPATPQQGRKSLEKKITDVDTKLNKLFTDTDKRVAKYTETITSIEEKCDVTDFNFDAMRKDVKTLQEKSRKLKESMIDINAKAMINNLIIGGIHEQGAGRPNSKETHDAMHGFMTTTLKIPKERASAIMFEKLSRIGTKQQGKHSSILAVFKTLSDKDCVKSNRNNNDSKNTGIFMHDQYPPEIVSQRRKLIPVMVAARKDGKDSYIKYNKLYVDGKAYSNGKYGKVE